jgi:glycosyltransferase involved in cell wall biosynthesis
VATNVVGNNEVCIENVNGFLFENEDEESGKELILKLYSNRELMIRFRNGGISVFEENFTVERMVNQHEKLYESMF